MLKVDLTGAEAFWGEKGPDWEKCAAAHRTLREGTGAGSDFLGQATKQRYQNLQDQQHKKCREEYESNPEFMQQAWDETCQQLRGLFSQWTGKSLTLDFVPAEEKAAKASSADPE